MQSRYFIMSELAAIAHDMDLLIAQLSSEQEEAEKREKLVKAGRPDLVETLVVDRLDKELTFIGDRFTALYTYYMEE